jgi:hypothetical protein
VVNYQIQFLNKGSLIKQKRGIIFNLHVGYKNVIEFFIIFKWF